MRFFRLEQAKYLFRDHACIHSYVASSIHYLLPFCFLSVSSYIKVFMEGIVKVIASMKPISKYLDQGNHFGGAQFFLTGHTMKKCGCM